MAPTRQCNPLFFLTESRCGKNQLYEWVSCVTKGIYECHVFLGYAQVNFTLTIDIGKVGMLMFNVYFRVQSIEIGASSLLVKIKMY